MDALIGFDDIVKCGSLVVPDILKCVFMVSKFYPKNLHLRRSKFSESSAACL